MDVNKQFDVQVFILRKKLTPARKIFPQRCIKYLKKLSNSISLWMIMQLYVYIKTGNFSK